MTHLELQKHATLTRPNLTCYSEYSECFMKTNIENVSQQQISEDCGYSQSKCGILLENSMLYSYNTFLKATHIVWLNNYLLS